MINKHFQKRSVLTINQAQIPTSFCQVENSCESSAQQIIKPKIRIIPATNQQINNMDTYPQYQLQKQQNQQGTQQNQSRRPLSWLLIILNIVAILLSSAQNCYIIYSQPSQLFGYAYGLVLIFNVFICLYTSCYLTESKWEFLNLYFLIDNLLVVFIAASIGFVSFNQFRGGDEWYWSVVTVSFPLDFFLLVGNFRLLMVKGEWSKCKIISYKFALLACIIVFFQIGVYFMSVDYSYTGGLNSKFDGQIKELMLLNVFGTFSLIIQMYSKMTDLDHTGQLQATYELKQFNDDQLANNIIEFSQLIKFSGGKPINKSKFSNKK